MKIEIRVVTQFVSNLVLGKFIKIYLYIYLYIAINNTILAKNKMDDSENIEILSHYKYSYSKNHRKFASILYDLHKENDISNITHFDSIKEWQRHHMQSWKGYYTTLIDFNQRNDVAENFSQQKSKKNYCRRTFQTMANDKNKRNLTTIKNVHSLTWEQIMSFDECFIKILHILHKYLQELKLTIDISILIQTFFFPKTLEINFDFKPEGIMRNLKKIHCLQCDVIFEFDECKCISKLISSMI